jgi:hypothetical protein
LRWYKSAKVKPKGRFNVASRSFISLILKGKYRLL